MLDLNSVIPEIVFYSYRMCTPSWVIEKNVIDFHDLTYIVGGCGAYSIDGEEIPVKKGDLIYIPSYSQRFAYTSPVNLMEMYAVNFNLFEFNNVNNLSRLPFQRSTYIGEQPTLISNYKKLTISWMDKNEGYVMETRAIFMTILNDLIKEICYNQPIFSFDKRIAYIKDYIHHHYNESISVGKLAKKVNLNPIYFGALFKKTIGFTVNEYLNIVRINNAENFMKSDNITITEAAAKCGFEDAFYFSKVFKKYKGYPPSKIDRLISSKI